MIYRSTDAVPRFDTCLTDTIRSIWGIFSKPSVRIQIKRPHMQLKGSDTFSARSGWDRENAADPGKPEPEENRKKMYPTPNGTYFTEPCHGNTRKDTEPFPVRQFIFPCFSVCFRGHHVLSMAELNSHTRKLPEENGTNCIRPLYLTRCKITDLMHCSLRGA